MLFDLLLEIDITGFRSAHGIPHHRVRTYIVGFRDDLPAFKTKCHEEFPANVFPEPLPVCGMLQEFINMKLAGHFNETSPATVKNNITKA
jgi:site-specific DNA-cytosine methylase